MAHSDEGSQEHDLPGLIAAVHAHLERMEQLVETSAGRSAAAGHHSPASWRRATESEHRLPPALAAAVAIALQFALPNRLVIGPVWLLPSLEALLLVGLVGVNPRRITRTSKAIRAASIALIALITVANASSSALLIKELIEGTNGDNAQLLLGRGASIYITNIIVFALWYWEGDRGGAVRRSEGADEDPDFLFPQMAQPAVGPRNWRPTFVDYLYVSFTNAAAFSPTDTMPLTRRAKMLMLIQSAVALITVGLVIARAVNVLK
jgi:uncharacterized membrane protein